MLQSKKIEYQDSQTILEGYCAFDSTVSGKRPVILIAHDWSGCNEFVCNKADKLAELGYIGFAIDMYGKGIKGETKEEKMALIKPFMEDRKLLAKRMYSALTTAKQLEHADTSHIAAIGFCFGGLCVLDLARSGADLRGVVSFHGLLFPPPQHKNEKIQAKILALHGQDDPMVPAEQVAAFQAEMTAAHVDWQMHIYGGTMHAFTNPQANDPGFGTVYKAIADQRSWMAMKDFFAEIF